MSGKTIKSSREQDLLDSMADLEAYAQHQADCVRDYGTRSCSCGLWEVFAEARALRYPDRKL